MEIRNNKLYLGGVSAEELVKKFGSPLYAYEEDTIVNNYKKIVSVLPYPKLKMLYACKANTNAAIMRKLKELGCGLDVVSPGELKLALKLGFKPENILFTATSVTDEELKEAIANKVLVNMDSLSEMERYGRLNPNSRISVRINPEVGAGFHNHVITGGPDSKFGIYYTQVEEIKKTAARHRLKIVGIHMHIGSRYLDPAPFIKAMQILFMTAKQFPDLEFVDFGGGIGVPYSPNENPIDMEYWGKEAAQQFSEFCKNYGRQLTMMFEHGRFYVAESGFLLCTVNTLKETPKFRFVGVDTGFNHLVRPTMYGSYHEIINASSASGGKEEVVIAGNICESGDLFTRDGDGAVKRQLPKIKEGDVLAICNAGAYGYSMSSNYNTRPRPAEILVKNGKAEIIREQESMAYLLQYQKI